tara:strand:- start:12509 stop:14146 length:1638 start_codon:yes stop_codon:yes gene_type:complete
MASNVNNCTVSTYTSIETANDAVSSNTLPSTVTLVITPDAGYFVRADQFNISGATSTTNLYEKGDIGVNLPNGIESVQFVDTVDVSLDYNPSDATNLVNVVVTMEDDYVMPAADTILNIDINGSALHLEFKYVNIIIREVHLADVNFGEPVFTLDPDLETHQLTTTLVNVSENQSDFVLVGWIRKGMIGFNDLGTFTGSILNNYSLSSSDVSIGGNPYNTFVSWQLPNESTPLDLGYDLPSYAVNNYTSLTFKIVLQLSDHILSDNPQIISYTYASLPVAPPAPPPVYVTNIKLIPTPLMVGSNYVIGPSETTTKIQISGDVDAAFSWRCEELDTDDLLVATEPNPGQGTQSIGLIPQNNGGSNLQYNIVVEPDFVTGSPDTAPQYNGAAQMTEFLNHPYSGSTINNFGEVQFQIIQTHTLPKVLLTFDDSNNSSLTFPGAQSQTSPQFAPGSSPDHLMTWTWNVSTPNGPIVVPGQPTTGNFEIPLSYFSNLDPYTNGGTEMTINANVITQNNNAAVITGSLNITKIGTSNVTVTLDVGSLLND